MTPVAPLQLDGEPADADDSGEYRPHYVGFNEAQRGPVECKREQETQPRVADERDNDNASAGAFRNSHHGTVEEVVTLVQVSAY